MLTQGVRSVMMLAATLVVLFLAVLAGVLLLLVPLARLVPIRRLRRTGDAEGWV